MEHGGGRIPPWRSGPRYKAYQAAQHYALAHGLELLNPTPFSDTDAIGVTAQYALEHRLATLRDLRKVAPTLTLGAPPQFQQSPNGLPQLEQVYGFVPAAFKPLDIGGQYQALDHGTVQAADVNTTDGQLTSGNYRLLEDPRHVLGLGQRRARRLRPGCSTVEGPVFAATINQVSSLLTTAGRCDASTPRWTSRTRTRRPWRATS